MSTWKFVVLNLASIAPIGIYGTLIGRGAVLGDPAIIILSFVGALLLMAAYWMRLFGWGERD